MSFQGAFNKYGSGKKPKPKQQKQNKPRPKQGGGNKPKKPRPKTSGDLYEPASLLAKKSLKKGARALTRMELGPQIGAYKRLVSQLQAQKAAEAGGLESLGNRTSGAVSDVYRNLAASQAENVARQNTIGGMLNSQTAQNSQQAQQALTSAQTGQLGALQEGMQMRGAPGGGQAQQQLANMVAAQQARQAQTNLSAQNLAASQAAGYAQLGSSQAAAEQSRGAEAQRDIRSTVLSRIGEANLKSNLDINEAEGKLAETRGLRGPTKVKNLLDLREKERDFALGLAATKTDRAKIGADLKKAKLSARVSSANSKRSAAQSNINSIRSAKTSTANSKRSAKDSGSSNDNKKTYQNVAAQGRQLLAIHVPQNNKEWNLLAQKLSTTTNATLVNKWIKKQKAKHAAPAPSSQPFGGF